MRKNTYMNWGNLYKFLFLCAVVAISTQAAAQVRLRVTVNSGSSGTQCTDNFLGGAPDPQWRVEIGGQGFTTYPRSGICFTNPPNTQFDETYLCPSDYPGTMQVCFRALEDDGTACVINGDCEVTLCQNFTVPAPGTSATYTLTIPNNGSNRSWGTVNFTLQATGAFTLPGFANDQICNAIDLGALASGGSVGNNGLSNFGNFCAGNAGEPNPPNWNNEQGVWFRFTTSANPSSVIRIDATNDPQGRGDQIDLQLALYSSSNGTCTGALTRIASEHDIPLYAEEMSVECLLPNTTYFLLIDGADNGIFGGQEGFFGLQIFDGGIRQAGDFICDAEFLGTVPAGGQVGTPNLSRSNVCATNTNDPNPGVWNPVQSVWFSFIAPPSGNAIIFAESDLPAPFGTDAVDLQLAVYSTNNNNCSGALTYLEGSYNILGFNEELNVRCLEPGRIYWILVNGSGLNREGIFDIRVSDGGIPPAPNDQICDAIPLGQPAPNGTVGLNDQNNFCANNIFEPIPSNWGNDQGVWYTFIAPPSGKVEIRGVSQGILDDPIDLQFAVYDSDDMTCSGRLTEIKSEHEGIGFLWDEDMEVECLIPGRTYFLLVDGEGSLINPGLQEGIFDIEVYGDPRDPPAPNDLICNAVHIGDPTGTTLRTGPVPGHGSQNNFCATGAGEPDPSGFNPNQTVWYSFIAPSTGNVRIRGVSDALFSGEDPVDLQIAVWEASNDACAGGTFREIQSGDDLLYDFDMEVYCLDPGRIYFVQIDGAGPVLLGGHEGYFDLFFSEMAPIPVAPNDLLCNAIDMGNPFTQGVRNITNQHNLCADNIGDPTPSAFSPRQTVWYSFQTPPTGTTYAVNIDATSSLPWPFGSRDAIDLQLAVYASSTNDCTGTLTEIESEYDPGFFDESVLVQCLEPGRTYFVMVNGSWLDRQGYFDLEISQATSVPIPTNDLICDHIDLGNVPVGGNINNGTNYFNFCAGTQPGEPSPFGIDQTVWFSFVAPAHAGANATANVRVRVTSDPGNVGNDIDLQLAVYESSDNTCTGSMRRLDDADPLFSRDAEVELTCLYPGRRYWVQVDGSFFDVDGYFRVRVDDQGAGVRPPNNIICNAVALGQVPAGGSINDGVNYLNLCSDTEAGEPSPSAFGIEQTVWFSFQAPPSGNVTVFTRNDPNGVGDEIDLQLAVYQVQNCTGPFIEIDSRHNPFGFDEELSLECLVPGGTYYVQVDGADGGLLGGEEGYFTIRIRDDGGTSNFPYNNDICAARNFGTPTGTTQVLSSENNVCANLQFGEPGVGGYADHTVWYQFTAPPSGRTRIQVSSNSIFFGLDPEIYLFASSNNTCTGTFTRVESSNWPTALITETIEATCLIPGNTYFLQVDGQGIVLEGDFTIRIVDMFPQYGTGNPGDPEPSNNYCNDAIGLVVQSESCFNGGGSFQTFNYGEATISYNPNSVRNCGGNCGDTWYSFTMPSTGIAVVEANDDGIGSSLPFGDFSTAAVAAYTGNCNSLSPLACTRGGFVDDVSYEIAAPPGTTVYLQVFNHNGEDHSEEYELCVSQGCGADYCLNAVNFPIIPNVPYCFNTAGATGENVTGGAPGYFTCGQNTNPRHSVYYYFVSDCNGSDVTLRIINAQAQGTCILGITPTEGFSVSFFQDATPCDNSPQALVDCQNFNSCMVQPINWSQTYTNLLPNTPYMIQIEGGFNFLGGNANGYIMIETTTNPVAVPIVTPLTCGSGANDGTATVLVAGGLPPFSFLWSNSQTDSVITNLASGTYSVTITGANGCTDTASMFVPAPANAVVANINSVVNETCFNQCDGAATVAGSDGLPPYRYQWDALAGGQTTANATGLCAGNYSVTVTDNANCYQTTVVSISNPAPITATIASATDATCVGCDGQAQAQGAGGTIAFAYNFQWSTGSSFPTASALCAGIHTVTVSDDNGCSTVATVSISQPVSITATLGNVANNQCAGSNNATAEILAGGGQIPYTFDIGTGSQTTGIFTGLAAGAYQATVSDAVGCRDFVPFTITEPSALTAALVSSIDVSCYGDDDGELTIAADVGTGTAPYRYSIDGFNFQNSGSFTALLAGNYTIIVRDANNCTVSVPATIIEPNAITVTTTSQTNAACGVCDGTANINVSGGAGGYSFLWSNNSSNQNATALCAGNAQVTVTDANGCFVEHQINISNSAGFSVTPNISQEVSCAGACDAAIGITPVSGTAPYAFQWANGSTSANQTGLCAGSYVVTITDANNCFVIQTIDIVEPAPLSAQAAELSPAACAGSATGQAIATAIGGTAPYAYLWANSNTNATATALAQGSHSVTVSDARGCVAIATTTISEPAAVSVSIQNVIASDCASTGCTGDATAVPSAGIAPYSYLWSNGTNIANPSNLCPNFNTVTVTDANGCTATASVNIPANTSLQITATTASGVSCFGANNGSASVSATGGTPAAGGYTYLWSNNASTAAINSLPAGAYQVTVSDIDGCSAATVVQVSSPDLLEVDLQSTQNLNGFDIACFGGVGAVQSNTSGGTAPYSYLWSNGITTISNGSLPAGTHQITATDANNCQAVASITLTQPDALLLSATVISDYNGAHISCVGASDGILQATASGGVSTYNFLWANSNTNSSISGMAAGTHNISMTDANGCTTTASVSIVPPTLLNATATANSNFSGFNVSCAGSNNGSANAAANGGTAPYSYLWSNGQTTANSSGLTAGAHRVSITDANNCQTVATLTLTEPTALSLSLASLTPPSCNGLSNGQASAQASGGAAPYSFSWSNGATGISINNLSASNHSLSLSDANGCQATASFSLSEPSALSISTNSISVLCNGDNTGSGSAIATGGTPNYTYTWSAGVASGNTVSALPAGTHSVSATDNNGCIISSSISVSQPAALSASAFVSSNYNGAQISCPSSANGTAQVNAAGGVAPYAFVWINGQTTAIATGLQASSYPVTVTDANGCRTTSGVTLSPPALLNISTTISSNYNGFNVSCFGSNDGTATASATGGTGAYQFVWSGGQTGANANNMQAGVYNVTVSDANGCLAVSNGTLTSPSAIGNSFSNIQPVSCFGGNNGQASANPTGGVAPYQYIWSNGSTNAANATLSMGLPRVTISDANGCAAVFSLSISQPANYSISAAAITNTLCFGSPTGAIQLQASGATAPYRFLWSDGSTNQNLSNAAAGTYSVTVTDANNCVTVSSYSIASPPALQSSIQVISPVACFGTSSATLRVNTSGGSPNYRYLWSTGNTNAQIDNLPAGAYSVSTTDANGCQIVATLTLSEPAALSVTAAVTSNYNGQAVSCNSANNGSAIAQVSGGTAPYQYFWFVGQSNQTVSGLTPGIYNVQVTDARGCVANTNLTLVAPATLELTVAISNASCFGANDGSLLSQVAGGTPPYRYLWSNGQTGSTANNLAPNTYTLLVTDANGCSITWLGTVGQPFPLQIGTADAFPVGCPNGSDGIAAIADITGGTPNYSVIWSNGQTGDFAANLSSGNYTATVTDANGCQTTRLVNVPTVPPMLVSFSNVTNIVCNDQPNGSATIVVTQGTAPYTFLWDNGFPDSVAIHLHEGYNYVTITDGRGCVRVDSVLISNPNPLELTTFSQNISCYGAEDGSAGASSVSGGVPPYQFAWSHGANTAIATGLRPDTLYWLTITDGNNCREVRAFYLYQPSPLQGSITRVENESCDDTDDGLIIATATGAIPPYNFVWSTGRTDAQVLTATLANLNAGAYSLTVSDANGCTITLDTSLTQPLPLSASATGNRTSCYFSTDGRIVVVPQGGTPPYQYAIDGNTPSNDSIFTDLGAGVYTIGVLDANGCSFSISNVRITRPDSIVLVASPDATIQMGDIVQMWVRMPVNAPQNPQVSWSPSINLSCDTCYQTTAQPFQTTLYTVTIVGDDGCPSRADVLITLDGRREIFVPNAFTPNGDGTNDVFMVYGRPGLARINRMMVFDRWGELVFEVDDAPINYPGHGWDGTFKGKPMNVGVFAYVIEVTYLDGTTEILKGDITLMR